MRESRLAHLQSAVLDLAFDADAEAFRADPATWAQARNLVSADGRTLATRHERWLLYRDLIRTTLEDPLADTFPITQTLLEEASAWAECVDAFLASRTISSPYYREVAPAFVAWLAASHWGLERWPFLLQLAHYEAVELEVLWAPDASPAIGLSAEPALDRVAVLDPAARNLAYGFAVQLATVEAPEPPPACARLLCHRDREGAFHVLELTPPVSALLARSQEGQALGPALAELGADPVEAFALLREFRDQGVLQGFRSA